MDGFYYVPVGAAALRGGCYLTSVGSLRYGPHEQYPTSGHPQEFDFNWQRGRVLADFALVLIVEGHGVWETKATGSVGIAAGDAFFILPGQWHRYRPDESTGWLENWICLRGQAVHGLVRAGILPSTSQVMRGRVKKPLRDRFERLLANVAERPQENLPSWGARALAILLECCSDPEVLVADSGSQVAPPLDKALRFIEDNCHRPLRVAHVAAHCGMGQRTFERHFKAAGLGSVGNYIIRQRVWRAQLLLLETRMTIKEISYICGFGGPCRMIYDFRACCGVSPDRWRAGQLDKF